MSLVASGFVVGCTSPSLHSATCVRTGEDDPTIAALARRISVEGTLRNAETVQADRVRFVSAELHRSTDAFDVRGEILTWATNDGETFQSVDPAARRNSSWPRATSVDLRDAGARTSRGCVYPDRGRKICIGGANSSPIPVRGKCPTATSTTSGAPR